MKLRIYKNSIRLRLGPGDVAEFADKGQVEARLDFGGGAHLRYRLQASDRVTAPHASYMDGDLEVAVPRAAARTWAQGAGVAISGEQQVEGGGKLSILIEKDFECLHQEGESADVYPNPEAQAK